MLHLKRNKSLGAFFIIFAMLFFAMSCSGEEKKVVPTPSPMPTATSTATPDDAAVIIRYANWDEEYRLPLCVWDGEKGLIGEALTTMQLSPQDFGIKPYDLVESEYYSAGYLGDEFLLSWFRDVLENPQKAPCLEGLMAGAAKYYLTQDHPIAGLIRHASRMLDRYEQNILPLGDSERTFSFQDALDAICETSGGCEEPKGDLPIEIKRELVPILWAINSGIQARYEMDKEAPINEDAEWWFKNGGNLLVPYGEERFVPDLSKASVRNYLAGENSRKKLYAAAAQIAYAIEDADWSKVAGSNLDSGFEMKTNAGWIIIRGPENNTYIDNNIDILLFIDLGGDDKYYFSAGSNTSGNNPVSIAIDLGGNDIYSYESVATQVDRKSLVPADKYGRYVGDDKMGHISLSSDSRQGGARNGIAMLFDLGQENDQYRSLRGSQGYAHLGVGVQFDQGGDDTYVAEAASQGAAQFGIAISLDVGSGSDFRYSFTQSQGFGYSGGAGFLIDDGGPDQFICNHGDPKDEDGEGVPLYYSPQMPGKGNTSLCQGAGFGRRGNDANPFSFLSGGIGALTALGPEPDIFTASVFAQGAGFWQGLGVMSVEGSGIFNARYYAQGSAAHLGIGILAITGSGDASFNISRPPIAMMLGAGHDFSLGVFIKEGGNDVYMIPTLGLGASNCNGIGIFVDNGGDDFYKAFSDLSGGVGNVGGECVNSRPTAKNIGIKIDAGGEDIYKSPPDSAIMPENNKTFIYKRRNLQSEFGVSIDSEGESGIHPISNVND